MPVPGALRDGADTPPPAPRGSSPTTPQRPWQRPRARWIIFFLALLALNLVITMHATQPAARVRIPYTPFFLDRISAGQVVSITSKGTAVQGTFTKPLSYHG